MKIKRLLILTLLISVFTYGQKAKDARALRLLNDVSSKVSSFKNIYIDFRYSLDNQKESVRQDTKGNVTIEKEKYLLNYLGSTRMFDGKLVYNIVPDNEEVTIEPISEKDIKFLPTKLINYYKTGYTYKWDIVQKVPGKKIQYIKLNPTDKKSEIKDILLGIDIDKKMIYNIIETGKNNVVTKITIINYKVNQELNANTFIFDQAKYKKMGYYIIKF